MRNIIVVDVMLAGTNFIHDIICRGYKPIVLLSKVPKDSKQAVILKKIIEKDINSIKYDFEIIHEQDSYNKTRELVKKYDPLLIIPGSELGMLLATKLSNDFGLVGNSIENLGAMTLKDEMQKRLAQNNLRHIRGRVVNSLDEAIEFYDEECLDEVVVKPIYSTGSTGVRICLNKNEMIEAVNELSKMANMMGDENGLIIKERINGTEYFLYTVSCNGHHQVTLIGKYNKVKTNTGAIVYDSIHTINELDLDEVQMVEYAYQANNAIGIEYGAMRGEYMIDDDGPVLIEVNCRPTGMHLNADFLDKISGQHETDSILDSYLKPELFEYKRKRPYRLYSYGAVKLFNAPKDIAATSIPITQIIPKLDSYYEFKIASSFRKKKYFPKTEDITTTSGYAYLINNDEFQLYKDLEYLRTLESMAFDLILCEDKTEDADIDEDKCLKIGESLLENYDYGLLLFVSDQKTDKNCIQVNLDGISDLEGYFDCVIINLNKSIADKKEDEITQIFLEILSRVRSGGLAIIPNTTYEHLQSKRRGVEALLKVLNFRIEVPQQEIRDLIIASKTL